MEGLFPLELGGPESDKRCDRLTPENLRENVEIKISESKAEECEIDDFKCPNSEKEVDTSAQKRYVPKSQYLQSKQDWHSMNPEVQRMHKMKSAILSHTGRLYTIAIHLHLTGTYLHL